MKLKPKKKLKTYVLMVAKTFPKTHPRAGNKTGFKAAIKNKTKKHTIRGNFAFWSKRIDKINAGEAILSIRQWSGIPYYSKQVEIGRCTKLGYEKIIINTKVPVIAFDVTLKEEIRNFISNTFFNKLAKNDGLSRKDFDDWFPKNNIWHNYSFHGFKILQVMLTEETEQEYLKRKLTEEIAGIEEAKKKNKARAEESFMVWGKSTTEKVGRAFGESFSINKLSFRKIWRWLIS